MVRRLRFQALELGLPFGERTITCNSRLAQELGLWAESRGKGKQFHNAAFRAYFAEGHNLAQQDVLLALVESQQLPVDEARQVLKDRSFKQAVDIDWDAARQQGITAVPTLTFGNHRLVGAQPYTTLVELMKQYAVMPREDC